MSIDWEESICVCLLKIYQPHAPFIVHTELAIFFHKFFLFPFSSPFSRNVRTVSHQGHQRLCHQHQLDDILNETLIEILRAKTLHQLHRLLIKLDKRSELSPLHCHNSSKRAHVLASAVLDKKAAIESIATAKRTKKCSSDDSRPTTTANSKSTTIGDDINWHIQLASKCYTDGFLSYVNHLNKSARTTDRRPPTQPTLASETILQRQQQQQQPQHSSHSSSLRFPHSQRLIHCRRRPLKPWRFNRTSFASGVISRSLHLVHSTDETAHISSDQNNHIAISGDETTTAQRYCCDSINSYCDNHRRIDCDVCKSNDNTTSASIINPIGRPCVDGGHSTMNKGVVIGSSTKATQLPQGSQHQNNDCNRTIDDQYSQCVYGTVDDRLNINPIIANRVNDLINSFYTLNLNSSDDITLPQIILTDFSNNSQQPTTTTLFLTATESPATTTKFCKNTATHIRRDDDHLASSSSTLTQRPSSDIHCTHPQFDSKHGHGHWTMNGYRTFHYDKPKSDRKCLDIKKQTNGRRYWW